MLQPKMPPQIVRLVILIAAIAAIYFTARHFLVPASFGQYGWYRANFLNELSAAPTTYGGAVACAECHEEVAKKLTKTRHRIVACESCHGAQGAHADNPSQKPPKITDGMFCIRCHAASPSKPEKFPQVNPTEHNAGEKCVSCHLPHQPTEAP